ncbi:MAG: hypothetical protein CME70_13250 [Halobacteriovorax sp.]|nr:hypothetical protein [Halobacteriovorax sp.]|tara:strand:- start:75025 stop:76251 length:1227 start_codon:yes stop_codon:yes gene_type:complete
MDRFWACNLNRYKDVIDKSSHMGELSFMLYFDHAASSPLCPEALKTLQSTMERDFYNPSAAHKWGKELNKKTGEIRDNFKAALKAPKDSRFVFTSSASESNNSLIKGLGLSKEDSLYVSFGDHASLVKPAFALSEEIKNVLELPLDDVGVPCCSLLPSALDKNLKLVLVSTVNSQSGGLLDVQKFAAELKEKAPWVHLHLDAVQSFGKYEIDLSSGLIDSMTVSAHKMGGPKGVGALWLKKGLGLNPLLHGGNQETDYRSSTIAYPLIASFYSAFEVAQKNYQNDFERVLSLRDKLVSSLKEISSDLEFPFDPNRCSPYIISMMWKGISSDIVLRTLEQKEVAIASTSACSSKIKGENPTMKALGLPTSVHKFVLRISLGKMSTEEEVDAFISIFKEVYSELQMFVKR